MDESRGDSDPPSAIITAGRVSWFNLDKQFGFVKLDDRLGDAFLHMSVLKGGGYYFVPRGTRVQVRCEPAAASSGWLRCFRSTLQLQWKASGHRCRGSKLTVTEGRQPMQSRRPGTARSRPQIRAKT